jgi:5-formyltetrahydrofolate cyclo-ligase
VRTDKERQRADLLAARRAISPAMHAAAGIEIARHGLAEWRGLATVAAYLSIGREPSTRALVDGLVAQGVRVLLPVVEGDRLDWAAYSGPADLKAAALGMLEPAGRRLGLGALSDADLVVVPALAADRAGNRLGRGRGYYDRALAAVPTSRRIAIVYASELVERVPAEPHDEPVAWALTPDGLSELG